MNSYDVTVTREDGVWVADIEGLTAATDVPRFRDLDVEVRDLIAGLTDTDTDSFDVRWRILFGDEDVTARIAQLKHVEADLDALDAQRDQSRLEMIRIAKKANLSERVIADVLGVSHQRVNQLANAS